MRDRRARRQRARVACAVWRAVRRVRNKEQVSCFELNNGSARVVVCEIMQELLRVGIVALVLDSEDVVASPGFAAATGFHVWVYVPSTGLHYDSEATQGVQRWTQLPLFRNVAADLELIPLHGLGAERRRLDRLRAFRDACRLRIADSAFLRHTDFAKGEAAARAVAGRRWNVADVHRREQERGA